MAKKVDLVGKVCPFPVMCIVKEIDLMKPKETKVFLVDDPLAVKSVPEEVEEYNNVSCKIKKKDKHWEISIKKRC